MPDPDRFLQLICELGPYDDDIEAIQQADEDHWIVHYADSYLEIWRNEPDSKLTLSAVLGNIQDVVQPATSGQAGDDETDAEDHVEAGPSKLDCAELYGMLLTYNFLWHSTGGVRMALDSPGENVVMLLDLFGLDLELPNLAGILHQFNQLADNWRTDFFGADTSPTSIDESGNLASAMRV